MSAYYGVQRSQEYLAHYGIKGMKWGVRKAIETKNKEKLKWQYGKAIRKLNSLRNKANIDIQKKNRKNAIDNAAISAGTIGISALVGKMYGSNKNDYLRNRRAVYLIPGMNDSTVANIGVGVGAASLGLNAANAIRSHYRTTDKGHEKAVKKAIEWKKEMKRAFKGTQYVKNIERDVNKVNKQERKRNEIYEKYSPIIYTPAEREFLIAIEKKRKKRG